MTTVLVTGGLGFIGKRLVKLLLGMDFSVVVFDDLSAGSVEELPRGCCFFRGDVRNLNELKEAMQDVDLVAHLAARVSVSESLEDPYLYHEVNALGTLNVLKASLEANVKRVVYTSTTAVYGDPLELPTTENCPLRPLSPYGASKAAGELYCQAFHKSYGLETVILRVFNVYGPGMRSGPYAGVIYSFMEKLSARQPPIIYGDGNQTRDFIYVDDVATAIAKALEAKDAAGEIFNIGTGRETSVNEILHLLYEVTGVTLTPLYKEPRPGDIRRSVANITKAKTQLSWTPEVPLEEGLTRTWHWFTARSL